jgi:hypothetical protein
MIRIVFVSVALSLMATSSFAGVNDRRATFKMMTKNLSLSGCYSIGKTVAEYSSCMEARGWAGVESDSNYLPDRCMLLDAADPEKETCYSVARVGSERMDKARREQLSKAFEATYSQVVAENGEMCFKPGIAPESLRDCVATSQSLIEMKGELAKMQTLRTRVAQIVGFSSSPEAAHLRESVAEAEKLIRDANQKEEGSRQAAEQAEHERLLAEIDATDKRRTEEEMQHRRICGDDYGNIRIGMSKARMVQCIGVVKVGEREGGIEVYKAANGAVVVVSKGKVRSWNLGE